MELLAKWKESRNCNCLLNAKQKERRNYIYLDTSPAMATKSDEPQYYSKDVATPRVTNFTLSTQGSYKLGGDIAICTTYATIYSCHFSTGAIDH